MTAMPIGATLNLGCDNCTAHTGAVEAYLEAKEATNDWAIVKQYVESTVSMHHQSIVPNGCSRSSSNSRRNRRRAARLRGERRGQEGMSETGC